MTKNEARKILGISRSASSDKAEQAYRKKQNELRLRLIPGNTKADRQKAQAGMAMTMTAIQMLQTTTTRKPPARKPVPRKTTTMPKPTKAKSATVNYYQKPQTLADAWELFAQLSLLPAPVTVVLLILTFIIVLIGLLANC